MNERGTETVVKLLAWLGIAGGILSIFSTGVSLIVFDKLYANGTPGMPPEVLAEMQRNMAWQRPLSLAFLPVLVLAVFAGRGLLRRQAWARKAMEGVAWAFSAYIVVNAVISLGAKDPSIFPMKDKVFSGIFFTAMKVVTVFFNLLYLALVGAVIYFLRRKETRLFAGR